MFLFHYIFPGIVFYLTKQRDRIMLWGLLLGNVIDLDHIYARLIGTVPWFGSACTKGLGAQCSFSTSNFGVYPLHSPYVAFFLFIIIMVSMVTMENKKLVQWIFWLSLGAFLNLFFDYLHLITGVAI